MSQSQTNTGSVPGGGTCTLLLFGPAQTYCSNTESLTFSTPTTLTQIFKDVEEKFPGFGEKVLRGSQVVVNLEYVEWEWETHGQGHGHVHGQGQGQGEGQEAGEVKVGRGDEVGVVPPVSAG